MDGMVLDGAIRNPDVVFRAFWDSWFVVAGLALASPSGELIAVRYLSGAPAFARVAGPHLLQIPPR